MSNDMPEWVSLYLDLLIDYSAAEQGQIYEFSSSIEADISKHEQHLQELREKVAALAGCTLDEIVDLEQRIRQSYE